MIPEIKTEKQAGRYIERLVDRIEAYSCSTAMIELGFTDKLFEQFPGLNTSHKEMRDVYLREDRGYMKKTIH